MARKRPRRSRACDCAYCEFQRRATFAVERNRLIYMAVGRDELEPMLDWHPYAFADGMEQLASTLVRSKLFN